MTVSKASVARWLGSGSGLSGTPPLPIGGSSVCSHTVSTTKSAPRSAASAAAQVNAVRLGGDPSTPTTMVFHLLTVVSFPGLGGPALVRPYCLGRLSHAPAEAGGCTKAP